MSLANMASTAFERRNDVDATAGGSRIRRAGPPAGTTGETTPERDAAKRVGEAAASIAGYIPSEIVTVYVAAIALVTDPTRSRTGLWVAFWCCLACVPLVVWLLYAADSKASAKPVPFHPRAWPYYEVSLAVIAFGLWAAMLPNTPFEDHDWYRKDVAGFLTLVFTIAVGLFAPLFTRPINATTTSETA